MANKGQSNIIGKGFNNRPENINRKGRPRVTVKVLLEQIEKEGGQQLTRADIKALYLSLLDRTQDQLAALTNNKDVSMITRIVAKSMLEKKGFEIIEKMLDRSTGKPAQLIGEDKENKFGSLVEALHAAKTNLMNADE